MEIFKDIPGHEGLYQVSNLGNVKSLNYNKTKLERILKPGINLGGYKIVILSKCGDKKTRQVHQLVAIAFLNHKLSGFELVVNHKDFNRLNNNVDNLEIVTTRENTNKKHRAHSSKYTGVTWDKHMSKWKSRITFKGTEKHLGYYVNEYDAHLAYEKELNIINNLLP